MIWRRSLLLGMLMLTGLLLETTLLGGLTLGGTQPQLVLLIVIALGMAEGPATGAVAGFVGGVLTDMLLSLPTGLSALVFTSIGYSVGALREHYEGTTALLTIVVAGLATATGVIGYGAVSVLFGRVGLVPADVLRHAGLAAVYSMLLAPFVLPGIRRVSERLRPRKVVRL
ncbi:MAG TPA: rod shape-determining protein MreD [Actinomycetota bacterium]|nr:rod shape-determining protein MreD [Actinomycetota bacterium]